MSSKVVFTAEVCIESIQIRLINFFYSDFHNQQIEESPDVVVEKWDWNAVKNALDDSARKFLISQENFVEDHFLMNWRLIISTIAVVISLYGIVYDWLHPFPESKLVLIFCVGFYFVFIGILTAYTTFIEKGCFAAAKQNDDSATPNVWRLSSKQKKYILKKTNFSLNKIN